MSEKSEYDTNGDVNQENYQGDNKAKGFKNKALSFLQTIILLFMAVLMVLTVLPVGLFKRSNPVDKRGSLIRLYPSEIKATDYSDTAATVEISKNSGAILEFNLDNLNSTDTKDIKQIKLRLGFVSGSGEISNKVSVTLPLEQGGFSDAQKALNLYKNNIFNDYIYKFKQCAEISPSTERSDNSISEIDVTDYARTKLKKENKKISFGVWGANNIPIRMIGADYSDPFFRPYLEIITGSATAQNGENSSKSNIDEAVYVSAKKPDSSAAELSGESNGMLCNGDTEVYLKFGINRAVIEGSLYNARLSMKVDNAYNDNGAQPFGQVSIQCINNDSWNANDITYNSRPKGEEISLPVKAAVINGEISADVTQAICEAYDMGADGVTFKITLDKKRERFEDGQSFRIFGVGNSIEQPRLFMSASDDADIVSATEAALNAIGDNSREYVTANLEGTYQSSNGSYTKISWQELVTDKIRGGGYLLPSGVIMRPKWFEGNAEIIALAKIASGDYYTTRRYRLTIQAETKPDYSKYSFGNYIDIGNSRSESAQRFDSVNFSDHRRKSIEGRTDTCRVLNGNGCMLLNFACSPDGINYLTLKLAAKTLENMSFYAAPYGYENAPIQLSVPNIQNNELGFAYLTYALPRDFTASQKSINLCVWMSSDESDKADKAEEVGVFAAYLTQDSFFEPKQFSKQGELVLGEIYSGAALISGFERNASVFLADTNISDKDAALKINLGGASDNKSPLNDKARSAEVTGEPIFEQEKAYVSDDKKAIIFKGISGNMAFLFNDGQTASIYERYGYYDRYSFDVPVTLLDNNVKAINFGEYLMLFNPFDSSKSVSVSNDYEKKGVYRDILSGEYYLIGGADSVDIEELSASASLHKIDELIIQNENAVLLKRLENKASYREWRVLKINGKAPSALSFANDEVISDITVKTVDGISDGVKELNLICAIYNNGKLVYMNRKKTPVIPSIGIYSFDMSEFNMKMTIGSELRIFVNDNTERINEIKPKVEYP